MRVSVVLVAGLLAFTAGCAAAAPPSEPRASVPPPAPSRTAAAPVPPDPKVGALFLGAGDLHTCTAGVLDSKGGDLILTAAHCVAEDIDTTFVAGFADTADPGDIWRVDAIYLDPRWVQNQDPLADFAILRVARDGGGTVETKAGGGLIGGTSGSPWTIGSTVTGLVGGLDGGGCDENVSYSPPFDDKVVALQARAEDGGPSDAAPAVFDDDC